ncbi:hypothetical protein SLEP1_g39612 [Rubroshorea leprosula]|uniref:Uncharacterized protein n=1 Tax=Rubroshorea leprosula TaxID=152421 RepID=A0AAV5L1W8_9ROSI|nr:hypothetical protein SLEP1_g39612 [Rubroshorea leprosula]
MTSCRDSNFQDSNFQDSKWFPFIIDKTIEFWLVFPIQSKASNRQHVLFCWDKSLPNFANFVHIDGAALGIP